MNRFVTMLTLLGIAVGCAQPQRLVRFHASSAAGEDAIDRVVKTLVENGQQPSEVDPKTGIIHTEWQDTGFMYGNVQNETATIHRRYTAIVTPAAGGADVVLRMDAKRCAQARVVTTTTRTETSGNSVRVGNSSVSWGGAAAPAEQVTTRVEAPCEPMDGLVDQHQEELDALGRTLRAALAPSPNAG
jgi:hypothetical protein